MVFKGTPIGFHPDMQLRGPKMLYFFGKNHKIQKKWIEIRVFWGHNGVYRVRPSTGDHKIPFPSQKQSKQPLSHENHVLHTLFVLAGLMSRFYQTCVFEVVLR